MALKHFGINDYPNKYFSHQAINKVIDYCNELERRLAEVEKKTEVKKRCNCPKNTGGLCLQHDVVLT